MVMWGAKMLVGLKREPSPPDLTKRSKILLRTAARSGERTTTLKTAPTQLHHALGHLQKLRAMGSLWEGCMCSRFGLCRLPP